MRGPAELYALLDELQIPFEYHEHPPVATVEEAMKYWVRHRIRATARTSSSVITRATGITSSYSTTTHSSISGSWNRNSARESSRLPPTGD